MKTLNQNSPYFGSFDVQCPGPIKVGLIAFLIFLCGICVVPAANVTLKSSDAAGTSSFTGSTNWSDNAVPSAGNAYSSTFTLRTPAPTNSGSNYIFGGGSLTINSNGATASRILGKIGNNVLSNTTYATITISNLILNGGNLEQADITGDNSMLTVAGNITVNSPSIIGAIGGTMNGTNTFETLEITAPISGSAALQVSGPVINGGQDTGIVKLSAPNPYSGTITVSNGFNGSTSVIASTVNRILQLNNLNALSNATLNLDSAQANPMSFASGANVGPFNVGALAGKASQTLTDTAGSPVTLGVGGNNASTTNSGGLTGSGSLVKLGSGMLTMTGASTYSGATMISGGSLQLGNGGTSGSLSAGSAITNNGNLTINRGDAMVQGTDFSSGAITGTGSFTQAGTGTTTLNVANNYSGPTTINAGELVISSAQTGTGAITVANGARLGVTVSGTSQLQPATLTLGTGEATTLEFNNLNSAATAPFNVGTLSVGGTVTVNINSGTFAAGNNYPLIHWTTSGPSNASSFTLGFSPGLTATFSVSGSTLYLNISGVSDVWNGTINGNWDTSTANWTGQAMTFANGQLVLFDDSASGPGGTSLTVTAPVQPGGVLANNSSKFYTVNSSGINNIGGSGSLTKQNNGTLTLSGGANTYTGVTAVNGGVLSVGTLASGGSASDIGAATANSANLVLNGGDLQYTGDTVGIDRGATLGASGGTIEITGIGTYLTDSGAIVGPGALTANAGLGVLALSGASTFNGGVVLSSGELDINYGGSSSANSAIGVGPLTLSPGTIIDNTGVGDVTLLPNNAQVWNGNFTFAGFGYNLNLGTGPVALTTNCGLTVFANTLTVGGAISGAGALTKLGTGALVLSGASTFSGGVTLTAGTLAIGNDLALGAGRLDFNGGLGGAIIQSADGTAHTITNAINFDGTAGYQTIFGGTGNLTFAATPPNNGTYKVLTVNNPQTEFLGGLGGASARVVAGTGTLILSGTNTYSGGTTINSGSTLQLGDGGASGSLSSSGGITNDGTLVIKRNNTVVQNVDISASPITGGGSFVQAGTGITTLNVANTYGGLTTVSNGELFITPAYQNGGNIVVANGAKFGVSASSVTNSAAIGNLALGSGGATTLDFSYTMAGNPTNVALTAGAVTISGTCTVRVGGAFSVGTFPVMKYNSLAGPFVSTVIGPRGSTATVSNDSINKIIYVTISSLGNAGIVWTGTNSVSPSLWDLNATTNWLFGGLPTYYIEKVPPGDAVIFNDQGSGTVLLSNTASPLSVTISNAAVNYTFQGPGQINSVNGLTKVGSGTVTMNLPAVFGGSTVISNGTFSIGASQTFANLSGNGAVNVSTNTPTVTVNNSVDTTFSGNISAFAFTKSGGTNQLTLTGSNNLSGTLYVNAGTLTLNSGSISQNGYCSLGHVGTDNGTLTLKGTGSFTNNNDFNVGDVGASVGTLNIQDNASLTVNQFFIGSANATGSTASGTVNQSGGTVTQLASGAGTFCIGGRVDGTSVGGVGIYNMSGGTLTAASGFRVGSAGTGTFTQSGGVVYANGDVNIARIAGSAGTYNLNGGILCVPRVTSSTGTNAIFNFNGGVVQATNPAAPFVGSLTAANVLAGGAIFDSGTNNITIAQPLLNGGGGGGLTKLGAGTLYLDSANTYTGNTVVSNGILAGVGVAAGSVLVEANGAIGAGDAGDAIGTLTINNNLTLQGGGATFRINKTGGTRVNDLIAVTGTANYGGTLVITNITSDATALTNGDTFQLFTASTHSGSFSSIVGSPGNGLAYSFANGVLSVVNGVASNPTNIVVSLSGGALTLSWPADHIGWTLQVQTNALSVGLRTNWADVAGSTTTNMVSIPIVKTNGVTFYRLKL